MRPRRQKIQQAHFCLLVNKRAANYAEGPIRQLIGAIKRRRWFYTIFEPGSARELHDLARVASGLKKDERLAQFQTRTRGDVTALVACGGDGTFNLVAQAAFEAKMPMGVLPMGRDNNIARSVCGSDQPETVLKALVKMNYLRIDAAKVGGRLFFGSIGLGYMPALLKLLEGAKPPRFGFSWAKLGARVSSVVKPGPMVLKVDSFRFDVKPRLFNVNLLPYTAGLMVAPAAILDDGRAEIIFDVGADDKDLSEFARLVYKKKYLYGTTVRLFRGVAISFQAAPGELLYLDGELIQPPAQAIEVQISDEKLKVFA
jgi:diacylglycerol kinase (ATP)